MSESCRSVRLGELLVDESLSFRVARFLGGTGHDVVHAGDAGLLGASDVEVMQAARNDGRVLVSADTDFGELLAIGRHPGPSVVIFRRAPRRPEAQVRLLLGALEESEEELRAGAVVVLTAEWMRIRMLPIEDKG
jgi:predicted nuclease of predicted toxin-antitoxin system